MRSGNILDRTRRRHVEVTKIIAEIVPKNPKPHKARELLAGTAKVSKGPGRPKGTKNSKPSASHKRKLSPEGRKRIADAMKRRWAERRKLAAKTAGAAK